MQPEQAAKLCARAAETGLAVGRAQGVNQGVYRGAVVTASALTVGAVVLLIVHAQSKARQEQAQLEQEQRHQALTRHASAYSQTHL